MPEKKYRAYLETLSLSELTQILRTIDRDRQCERYLLAKERHEALKALKGNERASAGPEKYQTAMRRLAAAVVDIPVVFGLNWIAGFWLSSLIEMEPMRIQMLLTFSPALYAIVLIAVYGQTIGKFFLHVKVVAIQEDGPVTWRQSFVRAIVPLLLALILALTWGLDGDLEVPYRGRFLCIPPGLLQTACRFFLIRRGRPFMISWPVLSLYVIMPMFRGYIHRSIRNAAYCPV